jgi:hypothetical protein
VEIRSKQADQQYESFHRVRKSVSPQVGAGMTQANAEKEVPKFN